MSKLSGNVAVIIGSSGGIGEAITNKLSDLKCYKKIYTFNRSKIESSIQYTENFFLDFNDEASIIEASNLFVTRKEKIDLLFICTGILHEPGKIKPEKSWKEINLNSFKDVLMINAIGPALIAKHFIPHFTKDTKSIFAAISAKIGSIEDNRLGGWYSYRSSKAALNMVIKNLSIEASYKRPNIIFTSLHPGTVNTSLSKPFQTFINDKDIFTPKRSADYLINVLEKLTSEDSGKFFSWDGSELPY